FNREPVRRFRDGASTEEAQSLRTHGRRWLEGVRKRGNCCRVPRRRKATAAARHEVPIPPNEQCTGREFPSESFSPGRTARNVVRGRWSVRNLRRRCRRLEGRCLRRGIEHPQPGQERPSNVPCSECPNGQFHGQ